MIYSFLRDIVVHFIVNCFKIAGLVINIFYDKKEKTDQNRSDLSPVKA